MNKDYVQSIVTNVIGYTKSRMTIGMEQRLLLACLVYFASYALSYRTIYYHLHCRRIGHNNNKLLLLPINCYNPRCHLAQVLPILIRGRVSKLVLCAIRQVKPSSAPGNDAEADAHARFGGEVLVCSVT